MEDKYSTNVDKSETGETTENVPGKYQIGCMNITVQLSYLKSPNGILTMASMALSIIILITLSAGGNNGCEYLYGSSYNFLYSIASSWLIICIIRFIVYFFGLENRIRFFALFFLGFHLAEMVFGLIHALLYLIADIVVAARTCYQDGYKAAVAFGFFALFALLLDLFFLRRRLSEEHPPTENKFLQILGVPKGSPKSDTSYSDAVNMEANTASPAY